MRILSLSLSQACLFLEKEEVSFLPGVSVVTLGGFLRSLTSGRVEIIFRAGPAAKCLIRSLFAPLKPGTS